MTPQEKAKELIEKFNKITGDDFDSLKRVSKACAAICVTEIIKSTDPRTAKIIIEYWQEVLNHINS